MYSLVTDLKSKNDFGALGDSLQQLRVNALVFA
jgi:hypothetical protein